jgi:DNA-binding MarR family transcriptional regulator
MIAATSHPTVELDDIVHQRVRLGILAILREASKADFRYLKESLSVTDGNLSAHLSVLEAAGLVSIERGFHGKRPKTWVSLTRAGKRALDQELTLLRTIVARGAR